MTVFLKGRVEPGENPHPRMAKSAAPGPGKKRKGFNAEGAEDAEWVWSVEEKKERPGSEGGPYKPKMKSGGGLADLPGARFIVLLWRIPKMPA
jgi:hypothetical protein